MSAAIILDPFHGVIYADADWPNNENLFELSEEIRHCLLAKVPNELANAAMVWVGNRWDALLSIVRCYQDTEAQDDAQGTVLIADLRAELQDDISNGALSKMSIELAAQGFKYDGGYRSIGSGIFDSAFGSTS